MEEFQSTPDRGTIQHGFARMTVVATLEDKGLMGFLLDLSKFFEGEMCERQDVLYTQFVDASIEDVCVERE